MYYPGHDELAGLGVLGVDAVPQEGHEGHQVKGRALRHNVLQYRGHRSLRMLTCTVIHKAESALLLDVDSLDIQIKVRFSLNTCHVSIHTKTQ